MRAATALLGLALLAPAADQPRPQPRDFQFVRSLVLPPGNPGNPVTRVCATVPGDLYERSPTLADVRLFSPSQGIQQEQPYALTSSETSTPADEAARVTNAGLRAGHVVFDLEMPARAYSSVTLDLAGQDFLATARVTGLKDRTDKAGTDLGTFTLFDLAAQKLGRSTTLPLAEATFPVLHVDLALSGVAGRPVPEVRVQGAQVPPSREAQTLYTAVAESTAFVQRGRESVATFALPAHVPVERVSFAMAPGDRTNFSRPVVIRAHAAEPVNDQPPATEEIPGNISRVRMTVGDREIKSEELAVPATLGANAEGPATVEVAIANGDDQPLKVAAVRLEMRQRQLCFDSPGTDAATASFPELFYGNATLPPPVYDYARLFTPGDPARAAILSPERANPAYIATQERKSLTERHPELLWIALLAVVAALGAVAFKSARKV